MKNTHNDVIATDWLKQEVNDTANELLGVLAKCTAKYCSVRREIITAIQAAALSDVLVVVQMAGMLPVENDDSHLGATIYENSLKNRQNGSAEPAPCPKPKRVTKREWKKKSKTTSTSDVTPTSVLLTSGEPVIE